MDILSDYLSQLLQAVHANDGAACAHLLSLKGYMAPALQQALQNGDFNMNDIRRLCANGTNAEEAGWLGAAELALECIATPQAHLRLGPISKLVAKLRGLADQDEFALPAACQLVDEYRHVAAQAGASSDPVRRFTHLPERLGLLPRSAAAAYCFVRGRSMFLETNYEGAHRHLWQAFLACHPTAAGNMGRILLLLVPLSVLQGAYPSRPLLEKYGLYLYADMMDAARAGREGQVGLLDNLLAQHEGLLVKRGVWMLLDRLRYMALRNLIIKLTQVQGNHIKWAKLALALKVAGIANPQEEQVREMLEVVLNKYLKGVYSEGAHVLALAKGDNMVQALRP